MDKKHLLEMAGIGAEDWERTPVSVKQLVVQLGLKIEQLEQHLKELQGANEQKRGESQSQLKELP
jgi:transposase